MDDVVNVDRSAHQQRMMKLPYRIGGIGYRQTTLIAALILLRNGRLWSFEWLSR